MVILLSVVVPYSEYGHLVWFAIRFQRENKPILVVQPYGSLFVFHPFVVKTFPISQSPFVGSRSNLYQFVSHGVDNRDRKPRFCGAVCFDEGKFLVVLKLDIHVASPREEV
jgi:hypothetical protein